MQQLTKDGIASELEKGISLLVKGYRRDYHPALDVLNPWTDDKNGLNTRMIVISDLEQSIRRYDERINHHLCLGIKDFMQHTSRFRGIWSFDESSRIYLPNVIKKEIVVPVVCHFKKAEKDEANEAYSLLGRIYEKYRIPIAAMEYKKSDLTIEGFKIVELAN
jgi:hypothetical protein